MNEGERLRAAFVKMFGFEPHDRPWNAREEERMAAAAEGRRLRPNTGPAVYDRRAADRHDEAGYVSRDGRSWGWEPRDE